MIGGGEAGLEAAVAAATGGDSVILVDEGPDVGGALLADREGYERAAELRERAIVAGVKLLVPAVAIGVFESGLVPVAHGNTLVRIRAGKVVVAAGAIEQPLVFPGNDLVGVMLPEAVRRLVNLWSIRPAERAYVVTADDRGLAAASDLAAAGVDVVGVLDLRDEQPPNIEARGRRGRVEAFAVNGRVTPCDLVVMSGSPQPDYKLLAQAGAHVTFDAARGVFVPVDLPRGRGGGGRRGRARSESRRCRGRCSATRGRSASSASARTRRGRISRTPSRRGSTRSSSRSGTRP